MRAPRTLLRRNPRRATATERARRPWVALAVSLLLGMGLIGCGAGSSFLPGNLPAVSGGNLVLETRVVVDGVVNRGYLNRIRTGGATLPITSCAITGGALPPGVQARPGSSATPGDPSDDDSCVLIGTPTATGNFTFTLEIRDSSLVSQTVTQSYNLTIRPAFGMTAFQVVDAVAGRSYNNSFKVPTNLSNNPDPDEIGSGERGNGPGAATCTITGLPANMGFTCNRDASGIAYDVTLTNTGVLAAGGPFNLTISITDSAILQDGEVVVAGGAVTNSTTGTPFALTLTVRPEFSVTSPSPLTVVDAVVGRSYNKTFTFATNLQDNGDDIPNDVNTGEAGNGPLAGGCSINGLPADFNSVCTLAPGGLSGSITITSAGVTTAASTLALSVDLTDSLIPQGGVTVVPGVTQSIPFNLTIRNDFSITATNLVSGTSLPTGVQNSLYDFTLTVTTNTVAGPSEVGQAAENGNGAIAACVVGNLPAGLAQAPPTLLPNGCTIRIQGTPTATGTVSNITLTVTDRPIQQAGLNVVPARSRQQLNISLTVNVPMVMTLVTHAPGGTFNDATSGGVAPDAVTGRTYGAPRRDLLFGVTGGIPPYTWATTTAAPAPIACRQQGANREFFRCDSGGAGVTGGTGNLAVSVTDAGSGGSTPQTVATDNQGHATHTINVRAALTLTPNAAVNPPPTGVRLRTYGNAAVLTCSGGACVPLTYTAAGGLLPHVFTLPPSVAAPAANGVPAAVACAAPGSVATCTSGASVITAAANTYPFTIQMQDTANDTTPAVSVPPLPQSITIVPELEFALFTAPFASGPFAATDPPPPGVEGRNYADLSNNCPSGSGRCEALAFLPTVGTGLGVFNWDTPVAGLPGDLACAVFSSSRPLAPLNDELACFANAPIGGGAVAQPAEGTFNFTVTLRDLGNASTPAGAQSADNLTHPSHDIVINPRLNITSVSPLDSAVDGVAYSNTLAGTGGLPPQVWSESPVLPLSADADCGSLTLSGAGVLSGTPAATVDNSCDFVALLNDAAGNATTPGSASSGTFDAAALSIPVAPVGSPTISNDILINGLEGFDYIQSFQAAGCTTPGTCTWVAPGASSAPCPVPGSDGGTLPTAGTLGAASGILSLGAGSTVAETTTFGVCVHDGAGFELKNYTVVINDATAYVSNNISNDVSVIDTLAAPPVVIDTVAVGTGPRKLAITPDGTRAYVTNTGAGTVSVIDTTGTPPAVVGTVTVGTNPQGIAITPDGSSVYVANSGSNNVSVIDTATNTVTDTVAVGSAPTAVGITPDGTFVYTANAGSNNVSVIDTATETVVDTVTVGTTPRNLAVSPDGTRVYVSNNGSNNVSVIDTASNTVVDTVALANPPSGVAFSPDGTRAYVVGGAVQSVSVIDTTASPPTVVDTVTVGTAPVGVAFTPDGTRAYVTNRNSDNVSVINTTLVPPAVVDTVTVGDFPFGVATMPYPVLHFTVSSLPDATEDTAYTTWVGAMGGTGTLTWSVVGAGGNNADCVDFENGLDTATGIITATPNFQPPTAPPVTCSFDFTVTDSHPTVPQSVTTTLTITTN